jgi:DNA-binding transcriptional MerR regulator
MSAESVLPQRKVVTARQIAETQAVCAQTVRLWAQKGLIPPPHKGPGRQLLWYADEVKDLLVRQQPQQEAAHHAASA